MACRAVPRRSVRPFAPSLKATPLGTTSRRDFSSTIASRSSPVKLSYDHHPGPSSDSASKGPLIILHGLYGSKQNWRSLAKKMAQRMKTDVYALVRFLSTELAKARADDDATL